MKQISLEAQLSQLEESALMLAADNDENNEQEDIAVDLATIASLTRQRIAKGPVALDKTLKAMNYVGQGLNSLTSVNDAS